jgi:dGTPase
MIGAALLAWRNERLHAGPDTKDSSRSPGQRDRDRLLYSPSLRRLQAVTQVILAADEGYLQHNRLTHSLKVAQVGRRIAENLLRTSTTKELQQGIDRRGGLDPDVVEAAGLAHDLGHPPFGHIAETELQRAIEGRRVTDSFEGNAQSFRIVTRLAAIRTDSEGLDLTRASLNAILKYPWVRSGIERKWGCYGTDQVDFDWARDGRLPGRARTLEADIMDWADDITYAIHDVEDFFRVGLIPLPRMRSWSDPDLQSVLDRTSVKLRTEADPVYRIAVTPRALRNAWAETLAIFTMSSYDESATNRAKLSQYSSGLINSLVMGTSVGRDGTLRVSQAHRVQVAILKELTKRFVVEAPALATQQQGQRRLVRNLFREYRAAITRAIGDPSPDSARLAATMFPTNMAENVARVVSKKAPDAEVCRVAADTIAGMTESQATRIHHRLMGFESGSLVDPAVT